MTSLSCCSAGTCCWKRCTAVVMRVLVSADATFADASEPLASATDGRHRVARRSADERADEHVAGVVDADVDLRIGDRRRQDPQREVHGNETVPGRGGERERRGGVPGGERGRD